MRAQSEHGTRRRAARLAPAARREQLLACAVRAFARRGIGRASHADVAAEADVAVPTVFTYFKTRGELVRAVLDEVARFYDEMTDRYHRPDNPVVRAALDHAMAFASSIDTHPDHARVLLEWSASIRDESWPLYLQLLERTAAKVRNTIRRGQAEGSVPADLDPDDTALVVVGAWQIVMQLKFMRRAPEKVHRFLLTLLRVAIGPRAVAAALA